VRLKDEIIPSDFRLKRFLLFDGGKLAGYFSVTCKASSLMKLLITDPKIDKKKTTLFG